MSVLEHEIYEQPIVIQKLLEAKTEHVEKLVAALRRDFAYVLIAARGSSDNAARYAQYLFGTHNRLPVALAAPSLFTLYQQPPNLEGALVIGISQSGQSPDIVAVIEEARRQGRPALAITNDAESPLAQAAEHLISLRAGPEMAVAASKTYTASLCALALFSSLLSHDAERLAELGRLPELMGRTMADLTPALARVERYRYMDRCAVIGRGYNFSTACEIALKIKELTRVAAEPYSSADFRHGPIALVRDGFPVILVAPTGAIMGDLLELVADLPRIDAELLVISDEASLLERAHLALPLPEHTPEWLSPVVAVLPGQLFSLALALAKGLDPDRPEGLRKVTETL